MHRRTHERESPHHQFLLAALLAAACTRGEIQGEVTNPPAGTTAPADGNHANHGNHADKAGPPAPTHEQVSFTWESLGDAYSGRIQAALPTGETFRGSFHQIVTTVPATVYGDFYGQWYAAPWAGPSWYWGDAWPYTSSVDEFVTEYSGRVVARLSGDQGHEMRCKFKLSDPVVGMKSGGSGECQVSNGERITATFDAT